LREASISAGAAEYQFWTGAKYNLAKVRYQGATEVALLSLAKEREGSLQRIPQEIGCKICGSVFHPKSIAIDGEEMVEAYDL
jgi:hypothetical protein